MSHLHDHRFVDALSESVFFLSQINTWFFVLFTCCHALEIVSLSRALLYLLLLLFLFCSLVFKFIYSFFSLLRPCQRLIARSVHKDKSCLNSRFSDYVSTYLFFLSLSRLFFLSPLLAGPSTTFNIFFLFIFIRMQSLFVEMYTRYFFIFLFMPFVILNTHKQYHLYLLTCSFSFSFFF